MTENTNKFSNYNHLKIGYMGKSWENRHLHPKRTIKKMTKEGELYFYWCILPTALFINCFIEEIEGFTERKRSFHRIFWIPISKSNTIFLQRFRGLRVASWSFQGRTFAPLIFYTHFDKIFSSKETRYLSNFLNTIFCRALEALLVVSRLFYVERLSLYLIIPYANFFRRKKRGFIEEKRFSSKFWIPI